MAEAVEGGVARYPPLGSGLGSVTAFRPFRHLRPCVYPEVPSVSESHDTVGINISKGYECEAKRDGSECDR